MQQIAAARRDQRAPLPIVRPRGLADCGCGCPDRTFFSATRSATCRKKWHRWFDWMRRAEYSPGSCRSGSGRRGRLIFSSVAIAPVPVVASSLSCLPENVAAAAAASRSSWPRRPTIECSAYMARAREINELEAGMVEFACLPTMLRSSWPPLLCSEALYSSTMRWMRLCGSPPARSRSECASASSSSINSWRLLARSSCCVRASF